MRPLEWAKLKNDASSMFYNMVRNCNGNHANAPNVHDLFGYKTRSLNIPFDSTRLLFPFRTSPRPFCCTRASFSRVNSYAW